MDNLNSEVFLKAFIENSEFRQLFLANWEVEYFDDPLDKKIYSILKYYWIKEHKVLKKDDLLIFTKTQKKVERIKDVLIKRIYEVYDFNLNDYTFSFIKEHFVDYLQKKKLQSFMKKAMAEYDKNGKLDINVLKNDVFKTLDVKDELEDMGIDYWDGDTSARIKLINESYESQFKTGINDVLDELLRLKRKTVVAVTAELNVGKSLFLNNIAANLSRDGYNVLYLSLEMDSLDISKRIDKIALDIRDDNYFKKEDGEELVKEKIKNIKDKNNKIGKCFIRSYPPRSMTTYQIKSILERYKLKNMKIDIIIVDYLTLMRPNNSNKNETLYQRGKEIAEELLALAKEENCLIFTACQVNRIAYGKSNQGSEMIAESLAIPQIIDTMFNMIKIVMDDNDDVYYVIKFDRVRDNRKTKIKIFLKLLDNLRIVNVTQGEKEKLEELCNKKSTNKNNNYKFDDDISKDLDII